jgi:hypothetical protein
MLRPVLVFCVLLVLAVLAVVRGPEIGRLLLGRKTVLSEEENSKLVRKLGHSDFSVREAATKELARRGEPALEALRAAANDNDPEVARRASDLARDIEWRVLPVHNGLQVRMIVDKTWRVQRAGEIDKNRINLCLEVRNVSDKPTGIFADYIQLIIVDSQGKELKLFHGGDTPCIGPLPSRRLAKGQVLAVSLEARIWLQPSGKIPFGFATPCNDCWWIDDLPRGTYDVRLRYHKDHDPLLADRGWTGTIATPAQRVKIE